MKKNIVEIFFDAAKKYPGNTAMVYKNKQISYKDLELQVQSTAHYFKTKGIKKGDKILVFVPMSIQLYSTVLALFSIGAIVVFVDEWSNRSRLEKAIQVVDIDTIIAPRKFILLAYVFPGFRKIKRKLVVPNKVKHAKHDFESVDKNDTALITFTTGSTGIPKAANRTHQFLWEQFRILKDEINAQKEDNCLITLPIVLLSILGTGATGYIAVFNQKKPEKLDSRKQAEFAKQHNITLLIASPYYIEKLAESKINISTLKRILTGGAPVFPRSAKIIQDAFPNSENLIAYGSTEAEPISTLNMKRLISDHSDLVSGLCVGEIHEDVKLKIIKISPDPIEIEGSWHKWEIENEIGEIVVTGPHVLDQYYNSEKAFKENKITFEKEIWHRTGDSGYLKNNMLFLHGRSSQLITKEDVYISPFIIENQLIEIDGIKIGTIIEKDNNLVLCLEANEQVDKEDILNRIATDNIPYDRVEWLNIIPRDPRHYSKIEYSKLKNLI